VVRSVIQVKDALVTVMERMIQLNSLADTHFQLSDGSSFHVHAPILLARCPQLLDLIRSSKDTKLNYVMTSSICNQLLFYLYTGETNIENMSINNIFQLVDCASYFKLHRLQDLCAKYLIDTLNLDNCVELLAKSYSKNDLVPRWAIWYILQNYDVVRTKLNTLPSNILLQVLDYQQRKQQKPEPINVQYSSLFTDMELLYHEQQEVDLVVTTPEGSIGVHRCVLAANSKFFASLLTGGFIETNLKRINHEMSPRMRFDNFKAMIKYFYCGRADFNADDAIAILQGIEYYLIDSQDLLEKCASIVTKNITMDNCIEVFEIAGRLRLKPLKKVAMTLITENFSDFKSRVEALEDAHVVNSLLMDVVNEMIKLKK